MTHPGRAARLAWALGAMRGLSRPKAEHLCALALMAALVSAPSICSVPRDELESYLYHDLDLIGTFRSNGAWVGCFQLPDKSLRLAKVGSYLGRNNGRITQISNNRLVVTELKDVNHGELLEDGFSWPMKVGTAEMAKTGCPRAKMARTGK